MQAHKLKVKLACEDHAKHFLKSCVKLLVVEEDQKLIAAIMDYQRDVVSPKVGPGLVPRIVLLNWAAPCQIPVEFQKTQMGVLTWALHDEMASVAATVSPQFTYAKGKLHLEEAKMLKQLGTGHHNFDATYTMIFKDQCDLRDERPMAYTGRLVYPSPAMLKKHPFFNCDLRVQRRTTEVSQLAPVKMKTVEEIAYCIALLNVFWI